MNPPETETQAGPPAPLDSPASTPQATQQTPQALAVVGDADNNLANTWADLTPAEQASARQSMEYLGVTVRRARKVLKAYGGGRYLRRGISAALALNWEFSSLEVGERMLRWCSRKARDKKTDLRDRIEIVKHVAPLMTAIRQLCESSNELAKEFDQPKPAAQPQAPVQVSINNFPLPPVAQIAQRNNNTARDRDI